MVRSKSKRRATRAKPKRRTVAKKKTTRKRTTTPKELSNEHRQLAVYHNPFSVATAQPKIPDGKVTESLGFKTQAVKEFTNIPGGDGIMHVLLYPGQDAAIAITGDAESDSAFTLNKYNVLGFTGSNGLDWTSVGATGGKANKIDNYAFWRVCSVGLKLSLLNPDEENDGWWESVRVTEPREPSLYRLHTKDVTADKTKGTLAPLQLLENLKSANIVNEKSYATGLLRGIENKMFSLNPVRDFHDFRDQMKVYDLNSDTVGTYDSLNESLNLLEGQDEGQMLVNQIIDPGLDFIYVRIHGRTTVPATRVHLNVVSNQEITFGNDERESRFQTRSGNVGPQTISEHAHVKKATNNSAHHMVPP